MRKIILKDTVTAKTVYTALFTAFGVLLPMMFHVITPQPGQMFLPMHIPVLLCGLVLGSWYGMACGLLSPLLSSLLTGMPASNMLPIMMAELMVYGIMSGLLYKKLKLPIYIALPSAMAVGRIAYGLMFYTILLFNSGLKVPTVFAAIATGVPGIAIQLVTIPLLINLFNPKKIRQAFVFRSKAVQLSAQQIRSSQATLFVLNGRKIIKQDSGTRIATALDFYQQGILKDAVIVDKIVGKAAAVVFAAGGASAVYGLVMSRSAKALLLDNGISVNYDSLVDVIKDRTGQGICPIEQSVLNISDPLDGISSIKKRLEELKNNPYRAN